MDRTIAAMFGYNDRANGLIVEAAKGLADESLDRKFEMGMGSLRRTLMHIWAGEMVWLERWRGKAETKWPDERERVGVEEIGERLRVVARERDAFLAKVANGAGVSGGSGERTPVFLAAVAPPEGGDLRSSDAASGGELGKVQPYRDSKGTLYKASLHDMVLQMFVHSTHHRAQAVNMLRHVGAPRMMPTSGDSAGQVDYMMMVRKRA